MKALVTGANGFLGPHIALAVRNAGFHVRAATRNPGAAVVADEHMVIPTAGERAEWTAAVEGIDAVVHLAGRAHRAPRAQATEEKDYEVVNVENSINLARAAIDAGARHFVFLSTIFVNGATTDGRAPFREDDPPAPTTVYARTKLDAERKLESLCAGSGMRLTAVRTPLIYGSGAKGNLAILARALQRGLPLPFAGVKNRRAFVAAENVASFVVHRLQREADSGAFIVADEEHVSTPEFIGLLAKSLGVRPRLFALPEAWIVGGLSIVGRGHVAESLLGSLEVDTSRARATGWRPALELRDALKSLR